MTLSLTAVGTGTLPVSGAGVQSTVTVSNGSIASGSKIVLTSTKRVKDSRGYFKPYVVSSTTGSFVVGADKDQLPETLTFNYVAFASS